MHIFRLEEAEFIESFVELSVFGQKKKKAINPRNNEKTPVSMYIRTPEFIRSGLKC